jgi:hypothetical protein
MSDQSRTTRRRNRVFKSLHKPLTYLGVERTLFFFICVSAVGAFNLFNSLLAGIGIFIGGFAFGHWVTNTEGHRVKLYITQDMLLPAVENHTIPQSF